MKKVSFQTYGCKLNFSESSDIARQFVENGYKIVDFKESADVYVVNTCTVTQLAEKKCRNAIRSAIHRNPNAIVAVIGCFAQLRPDEIANIEGVNIILGNKDKHLLLEYIEKKHYPLTANCTRLEVEPIDKEKAFVSSFSSDDRTRSFLKIQDGCDYFCTYCAIPFARGRSRSNTVQQVVDEIPKIVDKGIKEVVLTGVNIGDFGKHQGENFFELIKALDKTDIERFRISSIEPDLLTDEIIDFVASSSKFLPHFHIPLQAGSNVVLQLMKRKYKRELFADKVLKIKQKMPHACIACDVIVGFNGETNEEFESAYNFIDSLPISYLHIFTYSERPDTLALRMDGKVPVFERRERSKRLQNLSDKKKDDFYKQNIGLKTCVLWESDIQNGYISGFTDNYIRVKTPCNKELVNTVTEVELNNLDGDVFVV